MIQTPTSAWPRSPGVQRAMPPPDSTPVQILLVEDMPDDADLMVVALKEGHLNVNVSLVEDGEEALAYLRRQGPHQAAPRPDLVLLDLHLPRKNGFEVLAEMKEDAELRRIPVVILTGSENEQSFIDAYNLHANCCVHKPSDQDEYARVVQKIERFWLTVAQRVRRS
jgi:chemotaxis family two-component system response regulator Rcp1